MEFKIIDKALENLEQNANIRGKWGNYVQDNEEIDGRVELQFENNNRTECFVEVKKEIRNHHIPKLQQLANQYNPFLLIVDRLYPNLKKKLKEARVNWLDRAGNIYFRDNQHFIWIDLHTTTPTKEKKNRAFTKTGLKVVFLFLHDEKWLDKTYREIAEKADVALGNIKHVLDGLKQQNFLVAKTKGKYKLINKKELLDQWITAFTDELKPRLHIDNFEFLNEQDQQNWKELNLEKPVGELIAGEQGNILKNLLRLSKIRRIVVAGGDTSGYVARALGITALEILMPIAPGAPLCTAHSSDQEFDGLEISLKGGQNGNEKYFESILEGRKLD